MKKLLLFLPLLFLACGHVTPYKLTNYFFHAEDLADIKRTAARADITLTTEKDLVRLGAYDISKLNIFAFSVDAVPEDKTAFDDFIFTRTWPGK